MVRYMYISDINMYKIYNGDKSTKIRDQTRKILRIVYMYR